jgi:hypothetical protein
MKLLHECRCVAGNQAHCTAVGSGDTASSVVHVNKGVRRCCGVFAVQFWAVADSGVGGLTGCGSHFVHSCCARMFDLLPAGLCWVSPRLITIYCGCIADTCCHVLFTLTDSA